MKILIFTGAIMLSLSAATQEVQHFSFKDLPGKQVNALLTRSTISGESGTIGYFTYQKGAVVPVHQHANEQYSLITKGSVSVSVGGKDIIVKAGEGIIISPNVPHSFTALEDGTLDIDFFAPSRMRKSVLFFPTNGLFIGPESSQLWSIKNNKIISS